MIEPSYSKEHMANVALTAIYMRLGFANPLPVRLVESYGGLIGVDSEIVEFALLSGELLDKLAPIDDWPGVYEYEVSWPFGAWLRAEVDSRGRFPHMDVAKPKMIELMVDFFSLAGHPMDQLYKQLCGD